MLGLQRVMMGAAAMAMAMGSFMREASGNEYARGRGPIQRSNGGGKLLNYRKRGPGRYASHRQCNTRLNSPCLPPDWLKRWENGNSAGSYVEHDRRVRAGSLRQVQERRMLGLEPSNDGHGKQAKAAVLPAAQTASLLDAVL